MRKLIFTMAILFCSAYLFAQTNLNDNSCATEDCHKSLVSKSLVHSPVEDGCSTCHEKKSDNHPGDKGPEFALVETGSDLCETCHETQLNKKNAHVPFTNGECAKCHSSHSSDLPALLTGRTMKETCSQCHNLDLASNNFGHGPYMSDQCLSCHTGHQSDYKALVVEEEPYLCFRCHQEKEDDLELTNIHPVFEEGCLDCHSPHSSPAKYMLTSTDNELCYKCHEEVKTEVNTAKIVHKPLTQNGMCVSCHTPHAGELNSLLLTKQPNLCFTCHSENINNKEKFIDIYARLSKEYVHKPLLEGPCTDCHLPHISENNNLLLGSFPKGNYTKPKMENFGMCFKCHDSHKITNKVTTIDTGFRDGSKNLHSVHVVKKKSISCQSCHDMHGADHQHIIGNVVYFGKWEMPINYVVNENGGTCLPGCHIQYSYDRTKN